MANNNSSDNSDTNSKKDTTKTFTVDEPTGMISGEMPSVTRLLNRKSLGLALKKSPATASPPPSPPSQSSAPPPPPTPQPENIPEIKISFSDGDTNAEKGVTASGISIEVSTEVESPPASGDGISLNTSSEFQIETNSPGSPFQQDTPEETSEGSGELSTEPPTEDRIETPAPKAEFSLDSSDSSSVKAEIKDPPPSDSASPTEEPAPSIPSASNDTTPAPPPKVQPATRNSVRNIQKLIIWDLKIIKLGSDPLGKGIGMMMQFGATSTLFLSITPPAPGSKVPLFSGTAAVTPKEKLPIWTGLRWDPTVVPEMWNQFIKSGFVELTPPGTQTVMTSNRNVVRAAFGIQPQEWLLLVRIGPANACRGVAAFISNRTLQNDLPQALPFLSAPPPNTKPKS